MVEQMFYSMLPPYLDMQALRISLFVYFEGDRYRFAICTALAARILVDDLTHIILSIS